MLVYVCPADGQTLHCHSQLQLEMTAEADGMSLTRILKSLVRRHRHVVITCHINTSWAAPLLHAELRAYSTKQD